MDYFENDGAYSYKFINFLMIKKDGEKPKTLSPGMSLKLWEILDYIYMDDEEINIGPNGENFKRGNR